MGIGFPITAYMIAQGGSVDPGSGVNRRNRGMVDKLVLELDREKIFSSNLFYGREQIRNGYIEDYCFETNIIDFPLLKYVLSRNDRFTLIVPNRSTMREMLRSAHVPHLFHILGSADYPMIVASDWLKVVEMDLSHIKKTSILRALALKEYTNAVKAVEQLSNKRQHQS